MEILNTSIFRKDDFCFESLRGTKYTVSGHLSTDFYLYMMEALNTIKTIEAEENKIIERFNNLPEAERTIAEWNKVNKLKISNQATVFTLLKDFAYRLVSLDKSKEVTPETIADEFDNYELLITLFGKVIELLTMAVTNPN